jgi:NTE family protein
MAGRALVLGGGGLTGIGWEIGLLAGLADAGTDLTAADLVVGTSAGASVAVQVTSGLTLDALYERQLAEPSGEIAARMGWWGVGRIMWAVLRSPDARTAGARVGRMALAARTVTEAERRAAIASRLPARTWPQQGLRIVAVDARTGDFQAFDQSSGVDLTDAVAASCAVPGVWPPVTIGDRRWIDGGMRSSANADLAEGYERVVVVAPMPRGGGPLASAREQVALLEKGGARVTTVVPDRAARTAFGRNPLDPARRAAAARAGRAQAAAHAAEVAAVWSS